jgi:hypothetical protein
MPLFMRLSSWRFGSKHLRLDPNRVGGSWAIPEALRKTYHAGDLRRRLPATVCTVGVRKPVQTAEGETVMAGENLILRPSGAGDCIYSISIGSEPKAELFGPVGDGIPSFVCMKSPGLGQMRIARFDPGLGINGKLINRLQ